MVQPSLLPSSPSVRPSTCTVVFLDMCRCYALQQSCVDAERPETLSPVGFNVDYSFYRRKFTDEVTVLLNQQEENKLHDDWVKEPFRAATIRLFSERSGDDWWIISVSFLSKHSQTNASLNVSIDTVMSEFWPLSASTLIGLVSYSRQQRIPHLDMHIFRLVQCYGVNEASGSW